MIDTTSPQGQERSRSCARNCGQCASLMLDEGDVQGRMEGFHACQKLPPWHLVTKQRPACEKFAQAAEKPATSNRTADLAELF